MGRSSQEQALQNRAKIVEKASSLFRERGVDNISVADVMSAVGMTTGGFYKHFASKDSLVQEAFALAFEQAAASWQRVSGRHVGAIIQHYLSKRPPDQACPMLAFAPHVTAEATAVPSQDAYNRGAETLFMQFLDHMRKLQTDGDANPVSDQDAKVFFAAMVGAGFLARATGDAGWVRSLQDAVEGRAIPPGSAIR